MPGQRHQEQSRRDWLRRGTGALAVSRAAGGAACGVLAAAQEQAQVAVRLPMSATAKAAVTKAFREALGKRRGGMALTAMGAADAVWQPPRAGDGDLLLDAAQVLWRPGSTVKPFLLELLAKKQLVGLASQHRCTGALRVGGSNLACSHPVLPGGLMASEALALSCNQFFAHYAALLPVGAFAQTLREAGFGHRQPFGVQTAPALVDGVSQPDAHLLQCLGQQAVFTTPLALLEAFRRLLERMERNPHALATTLLRDGLRACVEAGSGAGARTAGLPVSGKTGTGSARERAHLNGWFLSYAPSGAPRFVLVVFVEQGSGGADAAPVAGAVWKALGDARAIG